MQLPHKNIPGGSCISALLEREETHQKTYVRRWDSRIVTGFAGGSQANSRELFNATFRINTQLGAWVISPAITIWITRGSGSLTQRINSVPGLLAIIEICALGNILNVARTSEKWVCQLTYCQFMHGFEMVNLVVYLFLAAMVAQGCRCDLSAK